VLFCLFSYPSGASSGRYHPNWAHSTLSRPIPATEQPRTTHGSLSTDVWLCVVLRTHLPSRPYLLLETARPSCQNRINHRLCFTSSQGCRIGLLLATHRITCRTDAAIECALPRGLLTRADSLAIAFTLPSGHSPDDILVGKYESLNCYRRV
jgi:hypothetical protein